MSKFNRKDFERFTNGEVPVLVDFYADWCGPCKAMVPVLDELEEHYGSQLKVLRIDVEHNAILSKKYNVFSVPTFILFHKGKQEWKVAGGRSKNDFIKVINKVLGLEAPAKNKKGFLAQLFKR